MPAKIGRFRVVRRLGSGAFATVWLAEDDSLDSSVAIKVLADNWAHDPDVRARFEQEAQVLRRADSERLVRIHDVDELPDGRPYQIMTYAAGGTLAERLEAGPMPVRVALRTTADIARAVADLHDAGVLHRDLKPSNVLFATVRGTERLLVADLGLAKSLAHASGFTVVAGTPGYMAPEQSRPGGGLDVRADVHAIGAMAYQMLTGRKPAAGACAPSKLRSGVSRQVDQIVLRALDADRTRRWPSAAAFADAIEDVLGASPFRRRSLVLQGFGLLVAVGAAAALGGSASASEEGWTRVADASGRLSVAVPDDWAGQARTGGWNPASLGLADERAPGLLVGSDLPRWSDTASRAPGVFAGVGTAIGGATLPVHAGCTRQPDRRVTAAGLDGIVRRWTNCVGTPVTYSEVALSSGRGDGVYVQIRQADAIDRTDEVLAGLRYS
ncbi:serine/threonine-protein kinase [Amorphoplanes digitatis]|nr:serine/threonine-protein kinase [Actinoplanes digitatis]GID97821.1 serine/threonine protein kinase [Actinoplanes digitatis]